MLTGFGRTRRMTERAAARLPDPPDVLELDVNNPADFEALAAELRDRWGGLDGALHAIAFAPGDALGRQLHVRARRSRRRWRSAPAPTPSRRWPRRSLPLMDDGGSLVGMDFDATVAWPIYDWMGVAKAALESVSRYLARDLGEQKGAREPDLGGPGRDAGRAGHPRLRAARRPVGQAGPARLGHEPTPARSPTPCSSSSPTSPAE